MRLNADWLSLGRNVQPPTLDIAQAFDLHIRVAARRRQRFGTGHASSLDPASDFRKVPKIPNNGNEG
jgi:hypothetical protein